MYNRHYSFFLIFSDGIPENTGTSKFPFRTLNYRNNIYKNITERRGRVANIPALYSEVPSSNLGPETGYPDRGSQWFP
jgi:hypothetical protein